MKYEHYRLTFIAIGLIIVLIAASPTISKLVITPEDPYSELYLLGYQHLAEKYPYNIMPNRNYTVYFNVWNHVGSSAYYLVSVKLLNALDTLPDTNLGKAAPSQSLAEYRFLIKNEEKFENQLTFSISNTAISNKQLIVGNLQLNGEDIEVNKVAIWNPDKSEYHYKLLFELWMYNSESNLFEFNNRFVYLQLNCTK